MKTSISNSEGTYYTFRIGGVRKFVVSGYGAWEPCILNTDYTDYSDYSDIQTLYKRYTPYFSLHWLPALP